jgi:hypothetical protein
VLNIINPASTDMISVIAKNIINEIVNNKDFIVERLIKNLNTIKVIKVIIKVFINGDICFKNIPKITINKKAVAANNILFFEIVLFSKTFASVKVK